MSASIAGGEGADIEPSGTIAAPPTVKWKGFVAGVASGLTKLVVGHPFDTIKVRMQASAPGTYKGPLDCLRTTIKGEGFRAVYKGATPPAFGWAMSDLILMGSLHNYRHWIAEFESRQRGEEPGQVVTERLSLKGHFAAGAMAGWTVSGFIVPIEHVKAKLQMQTTGPKLYTGPIDCAQQIVRANGFFGLWRGMFGTLLFRSWIGVLFCSYEIISRGFRSIPDDSPWKPSDGTSAFLAGGFGALGFWTVSFPFDSVKNRMQTDRITDPRYVNWRSAARQIWSEGGPRAFYRGFAPGILRAFPVNASALFVWETSMKLMGAEELVK